MNNDTTIWAAAVTALEALGGCGTLDEIFAKIVESNLYEFGTDDPKNAPHVLDTEIRRKCNNSSRKDRSGPKIFEIKDGIYHLANKSPEPMSETKATGTKRIHRARDKEEIINAIMSENVGVFKEIWRLLYFAAQIGMRDRKREKLAAIDSGKGIDQTTFGNCPSWPGICYLIALVEEDSSDSLSGAADAEDLRISIFQEYANGGLSILRDHFQDRIIDLDGMLTFINDRSQVTGPDVDLDLAI